MKKHWAIKFFAGLCAFSAMAFQSSTILAAPAIETNAKQAVVADATTGTVIYAKNAYDPMFPASMTKMMTAHIIFEMLAKGKIKLEDTFPVSEAAWRMGGSKMFVHIDDHVSVHDLIRGIVIQSGNDACLVMAEGLAGSEAHFADLMNDAAKQIGMAQTHYKNSTGWPDPEHVTSPYDLFLLAKDTINKYPEYYKLYGEKDFTYNNIHQPNRNLLLNRNVGVDGLKTGHTEISGYGITVSGVNPKDGRRIIVVVNGLKSDIERANEAERLLLFAYHSFENRVLWKKGEEVAKANVWFGKSASVSLASTEDVLFTLPRGDKMPIKLTVTYKGPVPAPIKAGTPIANLEIIAGESKPRNVALVAAETVEKLSPAERIFPALQYYLTSSHQQ